VAYPACRRRAAAENRLAGALGSRRLFHAGSFVSTKIDVVELFQLKG
jgi:hypothetical protein